MSIKLLEIPSWKFRDAFEILKTILTNFFKILSLLHSSEKILKVEIILNISNDFKMLFLRRFRNNYEY